METSSTARSGQRDVYGIINDRMLEQLAKGIVPWRINWHMAGPPTNFISKLPYRGINAILLAMVDHPQNYFLTEKQLGEIGGSILPNERQHTVVFWNNKDGNGNEKKQGTLGYYKVYNVAQCTGIDTTTLGTIVPADDPFEACEQLIKTMPHRPEIKHKEPAFFYDPLADVVNMPRKASMDKTAYYGALLHQLTHSTGHHTRLDRMGLVQMREVSYQGCSLEELVAEIAAGQLYSPTGLQVQNYDQLPSAAEWYEELSQNKYLIFTACSMALKAIDFILDKNEDAESVPSNEE